MDTELPSTRPYLIRALHEWCTDGGFTPYIVVVVDETVQVPSEFVRDGQIVLNIGYEATSGLQITNDVVTFKARFGGVAREVVVPIDHVIAIYARENGQGMAFATPDPAQNKAADDACAPPAQGQALHVVEGGDDPDKPPAGGGKRPALKLVK